GIVRALDRRAHPRHRSQVAGRALPAGRGVAAHPVDAVGAGALVSVLARRAVALLGDAVVRRIAVVAAVAVVDGRAGGEAGVARPVALIVAAPGGHRAAGAAGAQVAGQHRGGAGGRQALRPVGHVAVARRVAGALLAGGDIRGAGVAVRVLADG